MVAVARISFVRRIIQERAAGSRGSSVCNAEFSKTIVPCYFAHSTSSLDITFGNLEWAKALIVTHYPFSLWNLGSG